jgi:magnesium chelatase family protein
MQTLLIVSTPGIGNHQAIQDTWKAMPPLSFDELCDVVDIRAHAGLINWAQHGDQVSVVTHTPVTLDRPFRAPHYTCSTAALVGARDKNRRRPGEIDLARHGVLFLDDVTEFGTMALDATFAVTRDVPGWLVCLARPCPCGYYGLSDSARPCACTEGSLGRHRARLAGLERRCERTIVTSRPSEVREQICLTATGA